MQKIKLLQGRVLRDVTKETKTADGLGIQAVFDYTEDVTYELIVDGDAISAMARRAAANKNGSARRGPFTVKVVKRERFSRV